LTSAAIARWLGGTKVLRAGVRTELELVQVVRDGLPVEALDALVAQGGVTSAEAERLVLPRRTLAHRRARGQALSVDESDKLLRVARAVALAEETMQDAAKAHAWLRRPNRALGGERPLDLLATEGGARLVEQTLGRLAHGVFS
jgi:putative toxin-antitoxin system antitoxin component (TIGR02293 family)